MPHLQYCSCVWSNRGKANVDKLFKIQKRAARIITGSKWDVESTALLDSLKWTPLPEIFIYNDLVLLYKCVNNLSPAYLCNKLSNFNEINERSTRQSANGLLRLPNCKTEMYKKSFFCVAPKMWNKLTNEARQCKSLNPFKYHLKRTNLSI